ncbi:MAG TPA: hypothetical protein PKN96_01510 [Flavobacterium sp.]|uniref:hypothetical protein n=1 Tax=Flavobacterium sp. TaxID=239 RepID=UPI002BB2DB80|nr:hypothetical protein [Flavobacterium sp.]HNP31950.1 hypothetical protein [Flavobacterium sp.]
MIKYIMSRRVHERGLIGIGFCILVFALGYVVLEYISTMEDPPLGNTIYILIGSTFIFTSILGFVVILKYLYDYKKKKERRQRKRKKHKLFYLKDSHRSKKVD